MKTRETDIFSKYRHSTVIKSLATEIKDLIVPRDKLRYKEMIDTNFRTEIKNKTEWEGITVRPTPHNDSKINCFTDGSKDDTSSGCAYIIRGKNISKNRYNNLGSNATVFQSEITALAETAQELIRMKIEGKEIKMYSDSQAAIKALRQQDVCICCYVRQIFAA